MVGSARTDQDTVRTKRVELRVTPEEKERIRRMALEDGTKNISGWIREQIGLPCDVPENGATNDRA